MKKSRFTETQIVTVLQKAEQGQKIADLCRELGISVVQASKATGVARSTIAYKPKPKDDTVWIERLGALVERHPGIGFDKAYHRIRGKGHLINRKNSTASTPPWD